MKNGKELMATETKEVKTKAQRIKEYRQKADSLAQEAKDEQVKIIEDAIVELKDLGFVYHILTAEAYEALQNAPQTLKNAPRSASKGKTTPKAVSGPSANFNAEKACTVCNGMVGHDGRQHRGGKPAFTQEELAERGILPPPGTPQQASL